MRDSEERSGPYTTLPGVSRPLTGVTPELINATPTPWPVYPASQYAWAPSIASTLYIELTSVTGLYPRLAALKELPRSCTGALEVTCATSGDALSCGIAVAGTSATSELINAIC